MKSKKLFGVLAVLALSVVMADSAEAFYHAQMGRFVNRDPAHQLGLGNDMPAIPTARDALQGVSHAQQALPSPYSGYTDSYNLYQYVGGRPLVLVDPSGLVLTVPNPADRPLFAQLLNQLCPGEGNDRFIISANGHVEATEANFCSRKPRTIWGSPNRGPGTITTGGVMTAGIGASYSETPVSCKCVCDAINSSRNITLTSIEATFGVTHNDHGVTRNVRGPNTPSGEWTSEPSDVCVGPGYPRGVPGTGDPDHPVNGRVRLPQWLILGHELCAHAVMRLEHPQGNDPTWYTVHDPAIVVENRIRAEHGCGCRTGNY